MRWKRLKEFVIVPTIMIAMIVQHLGVVSYVTLGKYHVVRRTIGMNLSGGLTMTNADKIRSMTDEQLADFLTDTIDCWYCPTYQECTDVKSCDNALLAWLKQEADND